MSGSGVARRCSPNFESGPWPVAGGWWPGVGGPLPRAGHCGRRCRYTAPGHRRCAAPIRYRTPPGNSTARGWPGTRRIPNNSTAGMAARSGAVTPALQDPSSGRSRRSFPPGWQGSCSPSQTSVDRRAQRAGDAMMADDPATLVGDTRWCCNRDLPPEPRPAGWRRHAASTAQRGSLLSAASPAEPAAARPAASSPTRRSSRARRRRSRPTTGRVDHCRSALRA